MHVFARHAVAVQELIFRECLDLHGGVLRLVQLVVDEAADDAAVHPPQQGDGGQHAEERGRVARDEALAQVAEPVEHGAFLRQEHPQAQRGIHPDGQQHPPDAFAQQRAAQQVPVVVEHHQQPDADAVGQHAPQPVELRHRQQGEGQEQEEPDEVDAAQPRTDEQEVYQPVPPHGQQQVGLHLLRGCPLQGEAQQEVQREDERQAGVEDVVRLHRRVFQPEGKGGADEDEVACPEHGPEVYPEAGEAALVVHRVALVGQAGVAAQF